MRREQQAEAFQPEDFNYQPPIPYEAQIDRGIYEKFIDNNELIDEMSLTLRGQIVDNINNEIKTIGKPILSEEAISWFIGRLLPYTSKIFSLSDLEETKIRVMVFEFGKDVIGDLTFPESLGINREHRNMIKNLLCHSFEASLYKAKGGVTMKRLLIQHHISETTVKQDKQNDFAKLLGRFKA